MGLLDGVFSGKSGVANSLIEMLGGEAVFLKKIKSNIMDDVPTEFERIPCEAVFDTLTQSTDNGLGGGTRRSILTATIPAAVLASVPIAKIDCFEKDSIIYDIHDVNTVYSGDNAALYTLTLNR
ncbi:MAG: hypothetical protein LBT46_15470 [Planctomycetaceae bacterium]|jgi:hypothetical protein|nr:hypothetical protein [Planctomycetaceae bacterium]